MNKERMAINSNKSMFKTAIEMFLGEGVIGINQGDVIEFMTVNGSVGSLGSNAEGDMELLIHDEVVYVIEKEMLPLLDHKNDQKLFDLYEYVKSMDVDALKYRSKNFRMVVLNGIEKVLLSLSLPLDGQAVIGDTEVFYMGERRFAIGLN